MLQSTPQPVLSRTGPDARNGLSLACDESRFHGLHSRVNVPGLLLRVHASLFRCPFGPSAPQPSPVCPDAGCFSASGPLQLSELASPAAPPASTPLWDSYIPLDRSVQQASLPVGPPSESARSPLTPHSLVLLLVMAADHRLRPATFPEACCSSNLLEPSSLCSPNPLRVKSFCASTPQFQQSFFAVFSDSYRLMTVECLWIKRKLSIVL